MSRLISNTSPLIILAKADLLGVVSKLFAEIVIPEAVRQEITAGPIGDPMRQALGRLPWLRVEKLVPALSFSTTSSLGAGESEAIELARRKTGYSLLIDDRAGRRAAEAFSVHVIGTLTVIAFASRQGLIDSFEEGVSRVADAGLYVSEKLVASVRELMQDM